MLIDLHTHSVESDGWREPAEVVAAAADRGVEVVALSDHDCVAGVAQAWRAAEERGLGFVPAIEITTYPPFAMRHILGHGVDTRHSALLTVAEQNQSVWRAQSRACLAVLHDHGLHDADLHALGNRAMVMPNVLARFMIQRLRMPPEDAWDLIHQGLGTVPEAVYAAMPGPLEAVEAIHAAGGLAVCAHPGSMTEQALLDETLPVVDGLEVYTFRHTSQQIEHFRTLARQHGLLPTVGTDFHAYLDEPYQEPRWQTADDYLRRLGGRVFLAGGPPRRQPGGVSPNRPQAHGSATSS